MSTMCSVPTRLGGSKQNGHTGLPAQLRDMAPGPPGFASATAGQPDSSRMPAAAASFRLARCMAER